MIDKASLMIKQNTSNELNDLFDFKFASYVEWTSSAHGGQKTWRPFGIFNMRTACCLEVPHASWIFKWMKAYE